MSTYDAMLAAMQKETTTPGGISGSPSIEASSVPMSGGGVNKSKQYSGANNSTPQAQHNENTKNQYQKARNQLLLEAKSLVTSHSKEL